MLTSAIALLTLAPAVTDFFPLQPGTKWTYDSVSGVAGVYVDTAMPEVMVGGKAAVPVRTTMAGRMVGETFYRVEGDTVYIVAYDPKKPLDIPKPVLKVGPGRTEWTHAGNTPFDGAMSPERLKGSAQMRGKRRVLDREVEILEVRLEGTVGAGSTGVEVRQNAIYARGIGLVSMSQTARVGDRQDRSSLTLIRFEPGKDQN